MAKMLDKKQRVIDFKLTPYGRYKLSIGTFKPTYYTFYDAGIIYDGAYAGLWNEKQNDINVRIKEETQYLATQALFGPIDGEPSPAEAYTEDGITRLPFDDYAEDYPIGFFPADKFPEAGSIPTADFFKIDASIGDAHFDGPTQQSAPSWKIVTLDGEISGSNYRNLDNLNGGQTVLDIPQIDITLNYIKKVDEKRFIPDPDSVYEILGATPSFADGRVIRMVENNLLVYVEEANTDTLTENFEIEVFLSGSELERKFFDNRPDHIVDGYMISANPPADSSAILNTGSVEYYFDVFTDSQINADTACRGASAFNKGSYYVDLDFDCNSDEIESVYYDIYGSAVGAEDVEICQT